MPAIPVDPLSDEIRDIIAAFHFRDPHHENAELDFKDLMRFRINNILLVSSLYDFYTLTEDGQLSEAIFNEFVELKLNYAARMTRVNSGEAALQMIREHEFDLVITMQRLEGMDPASFCSAVKEIKPDIPVVLLANPSRELQLLLDDGGGERFDRVFFWLGDRKLFLAIIKLFEDLANAPVDCIKFGVRSIIVVEDSPSYYSAYLPLIYTKLIKQVQSLIGEGRNFSDKLLRQRSRPKIFLARTYEEALALFDTYKDTLLGIITDMEFPKEGHLVEGAGKQLIKCVRKEKPDLPVLLQSSIPGTLGKDDSLNAGFADKNSRVLFQEMSAFIDDNFGFGDFVFRMPDGEEIERAKSLRELRDCLKHVHNESIRYHASHDHFSNWLMARTRFTLANKLKPVKVSQFESIDELREYLIAAFTNHIIFDQQGIITDFTREAYEANVRFLRIGGGSLGGKARGLAFVDSLLKKYVDQEFFPDVTISIPRTIVLGTDVFTQFMEMNALMPFVMQNVPNERIIYAFIHADFPPTILGDLREILMKTRFPLAVRSSSLLEDALYQPFAGIYSTVMLPNSSSDLSIRFHNLTQAIKYVYASTYLRGAKNYIEATGNRIEEEKMAVVIQELVGERHGRNFYPHISGVVRSYNYYPFGKATPKDGVANIALGLGKTIVDGGVSLQFSPAYPSVYPQFGTTKDLFHNSQVRFYAVDLTSDVVRKIPNEDQHLVQLQLSEAELHGTLEYLASAYSAADDRLYEGTSRPGPRILTFAPILKSGVFPLATILRFLTRLCEMAMNSPVEIEFAVQLGKNRGLPADFRFLQVRPMVKIEGTESVDLENIPLERFLIKSRKTLGNGRFTLRDVVYVRPETFNALQTGPIVGEIGKINARLLSQHRPYLLIGPGRWGSSDPSLGIPVQFPAVSGARAIVETTLPNMIVDPSQGSHFFQNLTSFHIAYFTSLHYDSRDVCDWNWLEQQPCEEETVYLRHIVVPEDLEIAIDGCTGVGVVLKEKWNGAAKKEEG